MSTSPNLAAMPAGSNGRERETAIASRGELAPCHREVMLLVMRSAGQQTDEAEAADAHRLPRIVARHDENDAVGGGLARHRPAGLPVELGRLGRDHSPDRLERPVLAGD